MSDTPDQVDALDAILNTYDLSSMRVPARAEAKAKLSALLVEARRQGALAHAESLKASGKQADNHNEEANHG